MLRLQDQWNGALIDNEIEDFYYPLNF